MPFDKLDDRKCLLRKPLNQFRWEEVIRLIDGQPLATNAKVNVEALVVTAKAQRGGTAYVKLGVVKKHLVFRVKAGNKYVGENDVIVVRNFVIPVVEDKATEKILSHKTDKPQVTSEWWMATRKDYRNNAIEQALERIDRARDALADARSFLDFENLFDALDRLDRAVTSALPSFGEKRDHKIMLLFQEAIGRVQEQASRDLNDYQRDYGAAEEGAKEEVAHRFRDEPRRLVELLESQIEDRDAANAANTFTSATTFVNDRGARATLVGALELQTRTLRISPDDLNEVSMAGWLSQLEIARQALVLRLRAARVRLDALEEEVEVPRVGDDEGDVDIVVARQVEQRYQELLQSVDEACRGLALLPGRARAIQQRLQQGTLEPSQGLEEASALLQTAQDLRTQAMAGPAQVRNTASPIVQLRKACGIDGSPLMARVFLPLFNRMLGKTSSSRALLNQTLDALLDLSQDLPDDYGSALRLALPSQV